MEINILTKINCFRCNMIQCGKAGRNYREMNIFLIDFKMLVHTPGRLPHLENFSPAKQGDFLHFSNSILKVSFCILDFYYSIYSCSMLQKTRNYKINHNTFSPNLDFIQQKFAVVKTLVILKFLILELFKNLNLPFFVYAQTIQ